MPEETSTSGTTEPKLREATLDELIEEVRRRADVVVIEVKEETK